MQLRLILFSLSLALIGSATCAGSVYATDAAPASCAAADPAASGLSAAELQDDAVYDDGSEVTPWDVAGIDDPVAFKVSFKAFQEMVRLKQKDRIADLVNYPASGGRGIGSRKEFLRKYSRIFNAKLRQQIADQKLSQLWHNYQGVMVADGRLWFTQDYVTHELRIIAIN